MRKLLIRLALWAVASPLSTAAVAGDVSHLCAAGYDALRLSTAGVGTVVSAKLCGHYSINSRYRRMAEFKIAVDSYWYGAMNDTLVVRSEFAACNEGGTTHDTEHSPFYQLLIPGDEIAFVAVHHSALGGHGLASVWVADSSGTSADSYCRIIRVSSAFFLLHHEKGRTEAVSLTPDMRDVDCSEAKTLAVLEELVLNSVEAVVGYIPNPVRE